VKRGGGGRHGSRRARHSGTRRRSPCCRPAAAYFVGLRHRWTEPFPRHAPLVE
jgi:hypothetical protein